MDTVTTQPAVDRLRRVGLRPTRQRMALAHLLFDHGDRHVTAEMLHSEVMSTGMRVSLATVYNTLHQFIDAGLLREIVVEAGRSYFDTNTTVHHHFFHERTGTLSDIPGQQIPIGTLPDAPDGTRIKSVDVIVRLDD